MAFRERPAALGIALFAVDGGGPVPGTHDLRFSTLNISDLGGYDRSQENLRGSTSAPAGRS